MKILFTLLVFSISMSASAATFKDIQSLKGTAMKNIKISAKQILENKAAGENVYGDYSRATTVSYKRKPTEKNSSTVKQLLIKRLILWEEDLESVGEANPAKYSSLAKDTLFAYPDDINHSESQDLQVQRDIKTLTSAINEAYKYGVKFFHAIHSNEDGTFAVLVAVDEENEQILILTFGYSGT